MLSAICFVALILAVSGDRFQVKIHRPSPESWKRTQCGSPSGKADIPTKWGLGISPDKQPLPEFPRPMMVRGGDKETLASVLRDTGGSNWQNLMVFGSGRIQQALLHLSTRLSQVQFLSRSLSNLV